MDKKWLLVVILSLFIGCISMIDGWKELDLGTFKISIPNGWNFQKKFANEDLFTGEIIGANVRLHVGYSDKGRVSPPLLTEDEYVQFGKGSLLDYGTFPRYAKIKKTIHRPTPEQRKQFPKADYIVDFTFKEKTVYKPIEIPEGIKAQNIRIDSMDNYVLKTIWPKVTGKGITCLYIYSRSSRVNFLLVGIALSAKDQDLALQAFKTIRLKDK
jgi:hypothetical protein